MGRKVPELDNSILRERVVGEYRVVYTFSHDKVETAAIWHSKELLG